ncbi:hypothetical protein Nepgr_028512 [Nepenthes gracilis]|uniref:HMA domain-containing protein n=1 Tax=Nepenthes gracilis TaxID=150966 RepID=A0AAD3Y475_NEPGR|nr:hypothetical protein Nepgr_028512 [Nepenthes gracilis]
MQDFGMAAWLERHIGMLTHRLFGYENIKPKGIGNIHHKHSSMHDGRSSSLQTVELKVRMCCSGCERVVKHAIFKLRGVDSVEVNMEMEKVTVVGYVHKSKVLKAVRRAGKRAEFWPYPNPPLYFTSTHDYFKDLSNDFKQSYNYYRHGYNVADKHGTVHITHRGRRPNQQRIQRRQCQCLLPHVGRRASLFYGCSAMELLPFVHPSLQSLISLTN